LAVLLGVAFVEPHGHMIDPRSRQNLFQDPQFPDQPPNWNPQSVWCDNIPQSMTYSQCGLCGDPISQSVPREHEHGGTFGRGNIAKNYTSGAIIDIDIEFGAAHGGYFEFELCPSATESTGCFSRLEVLSASEDVRIDNRVCVPYHNGDTRIITARVRLPGGVRCARCTLRWTYRTSYGGWPDYDICYNPHDAQTFRACSDIRIN